MKEIILTISLVISLVFTANSQIFKESHFKYKGVCDLNNIKNTVDEKGNDVSVYQCVNQSLSASIYRVTVISFKNTINDLGKYYKSLTKEYADLGKLKIITLKNKKAVKLTENINVEEHSMKQISVSTLYKNKAITLVLVTNSLSYLTLLSKFINNFSFL